MESKWIEVKNHHQSYFVREVGNIGCIFIEVVYAATRTREGLVYDYERPLHYELVWHEQFNFVYGEGIMLRRRETFPFSPEGLEAAKVAVIAWAKQLLQDALDSLDEV